MEGLAHSLGNVQIVWGQKFNLNEVYKGYFAEISSPSRFWLHLAEPEMNSLVKNVKTFYNQNKDADALKLSIEQISVKMKIVCFAYGTWSRAEVYAIRDNIVHVYFYDYGTNGKVPIDRCRIMLDEYKNFKPKAVRACLHGIQPPNGTRLWDTDTSDCMVKIVYNKVIDFKFVKYHAEEEFYEVIAQLEVKKININEQLVTEGFAERIERNCHRNFSVFYPSFELLEKSIYYPQYRHRYELKKKGIDYNGFEETHIRTNKCYGDELNRLFKDDAFSNIKEAYESIMRLHLFVEE